MTLVASIAVLVTRDDETTTTLPRSSAAPLPTPVPARTDDGIRFAYPYEPPTLDPVGAGGASAATRDIMRSTLPALFRLDARLRPQPELAAGWPTPADVKLDPFTVTVRLREATWSDGQPITSADILFSYQKLKDGPTGYRYRHLTEVKAPSPRVAVLRFDRPVRRWWSLFSIDDMILPAHAHNERWNRAPSVSGGPFAVDHWTDGLRVRLKRNDRYWGPVVPLARIDVLFVPDDETRLQLLDRDEVDAAFFEGDVNIGRRAKAYGFASVRDALSGQGGASSAFGPTWWELDLDPQRLRPAVAKAVMEAADPNLAAEIFEDSGRPLNALPADFSRPQTQTEQPWGGRGDLEEAKRLAGGGTSFQLTYAISSPAAGIANYLHFRLREVGITAELTAIESDSFERTWLPEKRTPAILRLRRGADAPDAASYTQAAGRAGAAPIDEAVDAAESSGSAGTASPTGVAPTDWGRAQAGLANAASAVPLVHARSWLVARGGVFGPQATGASHGPLWNAGAWSTKAD